MGFSHIQAATNGLMFNDLEFTLQAKEAGLHTLYLQCDGVTDDVYMRTRGEALLERKMKCIENVRRAGMKMGTTSHWKKAVVVLHPDYHIDLF